MNRRWEMTRFGLVLLLLVLLASCKNDLDKVAAVELPELVPDRVTTGAEYLYSDSGIVRDRLRAGRIAEWRTKPERTEITEGLELQFYTTDGRPGSLLTARRGTIWPGSKRMEVYDQVVFINTKGERLETEQLTWEQDSARVRTDKAVRVQRGDDVIHGQGLDAAEDFSSYVIRRVTGVLHLQGDTLADQEP
ncbi:MAG: LPS export ABC transporter periplasmic protein LptC [Flavobacteriales bacterium]|nr:LPS export ABC transporter periplasmic protein LptC [Flavobacteriales bacterium]